MNNSKLLKTCICENNIRSVLFYNAKSMLNQNEKKKKKHEFKIAVLINYFLFANTEILLTIQLNSFILNLKILLIRNINFLSAVSNY